MSSYMDMIGGMKYDAEYDVLKAACGVYIATVSESGDKIALEVTGPSYGKTEVLGKQKNSASFSLATYAIDKYELSVNRRFWFLTGSVSNALTLVEQELKAINSRDDAITTVLEDIVQGLANVYGIRLVDAEKLSEEDEELFKSQIMLDEDYEDDDEYDDDFEDDEDDEE